MGLVPGNIDVTTPNGVRITYNAWAEQILITAPDGHSLLSSEVGRGEMAKGQQLQVQLR